MTAIVSISADNPAARCRLAQGTELLGRFQGSGCIEARYLVRLGTGRMLEISRLLHLVAVALSEEHSLVAVAERVSAELRRPISPESVGYLIDHKLRPLGIVSSATDPEAPRTPDAHILGLAFHVGVIPAHVVRAVAGFLRPLFLPPLVAGALAALVVVDGWLLLEHRFGVDVQRLLLQPAHLLGLISLTLAAGVFHELGHATASRYGGAEPGVIGAGIYLIWPVFYNDLNDSYRLTRTGRLRADLGGVYFNVLLILMLAGAYWSTRFEPLLVAVVFQHLAVLQQFIPFLRLDGYYIVSDIAGVPDLFGRIRPILSSLVPGREAGPAVIELKPRARVVVTLWVFLTVPMLAVCLVLLVTSMPALAVGVWRSVGVQAAVLADTDSPVEVVLSGLQLLVLALPFVGLLAALGRGLRRCGQQPGPPLSPTQRASRSGPRLDFSRGGTSPR